MWKRKCIRCIWFLLHFLQILLFFLAGVREITRKKWHNFLLGKENNREKHSFQRSLELQSTQKKKLSVCFLFFFCYYGNETNVPWVYFVSCKFKVYKKKLLFFVQINILQKLNCKSLHVFPLVHLSQFWLSIHVQLNSKVFWLVLSNYLFSWETNFTTNCEAKQTQRSPRTFHFHILISFSSFSETFKLFQEQKVCTGMNFQKKVSGKVQSS